MNARASDRHQSISILKLLQGKEATSVCSKIPNRPNGTTYAENFNNANKEAFVIRATYQHDVGLRVGQYAVRVSDVVRIRFIFLAIIYSVVVVDSYSFMRIVKKSSLYIYMFVVRS